MSFTNLDDSFGLGSYLGGIVKSAGRIHRPAEAEPEPEEAGPETAAEEEEQKEKAVLRNPKWEAADVGFNEETDISVEAQLPEASAHKTKVAFELFAKVPGKLERISQAEGQIADGVAKAKIPVYIPQYKDADGNPLDKVEYYFTAKHADSDLLDDDTVTKLVDHMANLLIDCHIVSDVTFATDKSQVRIGQKEAMKAMVDRVGQWKQDHPDGKLAVFGHADAVGKDEDNKKLSEKRARAIHAFLVKDGSVWDSLAKEEKWKKKEDFDHQAFMDENNTLSLSDKDFDVIDGKPTAGCSEFNLVEQLKGASEKNRRVSVFLLKSNKNFPIQYPCKQGDIKPCQAQIGRKGDRRTPGFSCYFYDKLITEQPGACGAQGTVKFVAITEAEIKQYVNMEPEEGKPEIGKDRLIEVEVAAGLGDGDEVYWTITAGETNSARSEPKIGPKLLPDDAPAEFKERVAVIISTVEAGKSHIILDCGPCGGDEFTVEVGGSRDKADVKVKIISWRRLEYETIHPKATGGQRLTDYTYYQDDKGPGFSDGMVAFMDKALSPVFVEFKEVHKACFLKDDFPEEGKYNIVDAKVVRRDAGNRALISTMELLDLAVFSYKKNTANKRSVSISWCDYIVERADWRDTYTEITGPTYKAPNKMMLFEKVPDSGGGYSHGDYFLQGIRWKVTDYLDGTTWKPVTHPDDPGYAWKGGAIIDEEDEIKEHITYVDAWAVGINFPATKAHYPGKKIGRDGEYFKDKGHRLRLSVTMNGRGWTANFNGLALQGKIWMNSYAGRQKDPAGVGVVIAHELGHNMGQGYGGKDLSNRGRTNPIAGIPFPKYVTEGNIYVDHGHRGIHCANGIADKSRTDYSVPWDVSMAEHKCIMFGAMDMGSSTAFPYCEECTPRIRAEELTDIRKDWTA